MTKPNQSPVDHVYVLIAVYLHHGDVEIVDAICSTYETARKVSKHLPWHPCQRLLKIERWPLDCLRCLGNGPEIIAEHGYSLHQVGQIPAGELFDRTPDGIPLREWHPSLGLKITTICEDQQQS